MANKLFYKIAKKCFLAFDKMCIRDSLYTPPVTPRELVAPEVAGLTVRRDVPKAVSYTHLKFLTRYSPVRHPCYPKVTRIDLHVDVYKRQKIYRIFHWCIEKKLL